MDDLRFPLFVNLKNKKIVIVGGGKVGSRRAKILLDFGALVTVIDPAQVDIEGVCHICRGYKSGDVHGAFLCIAAANDRQVNAAVTAEAKALGIPVSAADAPGDCDFFFPAVCTGSGLVAGVVSAGKEHAKTARAAESIRRVLEGLE